MHELSDAYQAPATTEAASSRPVKPGPGALLAGSVLLMLFAIAVTVMTESALVLGVGALASGAGALAGVVQGIRWLVRARGGRGFTVLALIGNLAMVLFGAVMTVLATVGFSRGRQLRSRGRVLLPPVRGGGAWAQAGPWRQVQSCEVDVPVAERAALAGQWRENGRTEHASVAAFARLTLDLLALGAPPALVAAANADALDEIRHAELCFSLARALDGRGREPGAFPEAQRARTLPRARPLALAQLAVDSLVDGALHEGLSARVIARLARRCEEPAIRAVLEELAADEGRHAAHGWQVVRWCLSEGGGPVAEALLGSLAAIPATMSDGAAAGVAWERWGIPGPELLDEEYRKARAQLVRRVRALPL